MTARPSNDAPPSSTPQNTDIDDNLRPVRLDDNNKGNDSSDTDHDGGRSTVVIPTTSELEALATTRTSLINKHFSSWQADYDKSPTKAGRGGDVGSHNVFSCSMRDIYAGRVAGAGRYNYNAVYDESKDEMGAENGEIEESVNKGDGGYNYENMTGQEQEGAGRTKSGQV